MYDLKVKFHDLNVTELLLSHSRSSVTYYQNQQINVLVVALIANLVSGFGGSEEKFIRKYAMMKVYESCFGSQVLKEIRKEMKEAAQKCSGFQLNFDDKYFTKDGNNIKHVSDWLQESPQRLKPNVGTKIKKPIHTTDTLLLQQWTEEQKQNINISDMTTSADQDQSETQSMNNEGSDEAAPLLKKPIDFSKLEEAIMNIEKPSNSFGVQKQSSSNTNFQQAAAVGYYPAPMYYPPPVPFGPTYPYHAYYPGYFHTPGPAGSAAFQSFYRNGVRAAKVTNLSGRNKKEAGMKSQGNYASFQYSSKLRNVSCIMQELGYLDEHLEPNYSRMAERINRLYISEELKTDMLEGVKFCRQFSQCIPDTKNDSFQLSKELLRPMFFFKCYKHKKLESCIMKDIRERFSQTTRELNNEVRRSFRSEDTIFELVFGPGTDDLESLF